MIKFVSFVACAFLICAANAEAEDKRDNNEPKVVSGMSIVGNDETPKSLYIVPWKDSDDAGEANFAPRILHEELKAIDKSDFIRELDIYRKSNLN